MQPSGPRWLYLHGFASGPESAKGVALAAHYQQRGIHLERLNLRVPSFEHLRLSKMITTVRDAIGGERDRAILFGSSLGGLTACRVAEADPRVCALVLLAPALRGAERWRANMGDEAWRLWEERGWLEVTDFGGERLTARVDWGFAQDLAVADGGDDGWPDVRVPTLILHGRGDTVVDIDYSRRWARDRRWVELIELDDGHELVASLDRIAEEADRFLGHFLGRVTK